MFRTINRPKRTLGGRRSARWRFRRSAHSRRRVAARGDWHRIFDTLRTSTTTWSTRSRAACPRALVGTLYRNGPAQERGRRQALRAPVRRRRDAVAVRVRRRRRPLPQPLRAHDALPEAERNADKPLMRGYGQQRPGGPLANAFRTPGQRRQHQRHLPLRATCSRSGRAAALAARPGHARHDRRVRLRRRAEGRLLVLGPPDLGSGDAASSTTSASSSAARRKLRTYRIDRAGKLHHLQAVTLPFPTLNHDCALTRSYMVFVIAPLVAQAAALPARRLTASTARSASTRKRPTQVILVPRDGGKPRDRGVRVVLPLPHQQRLRGRRRRRARPRRATRTTTTSTASLRQLPRRRLRRDLDQAQPHARLAGDEVEIEDVYAARAASSLSTTGGSRPRATATHTWRAGRRADGPLQLDRQVRPRPRARDAPRLRRRPGRRRADLRAALARRSRGRRLAAVGRVLGAGPPLAARGAGRARPRVGAGRSRAPAPPRAARLPRHVHGPRGGAWDRVYRAFVRRRLRRGVRAAT